MMKYKRFAAVLAIAALALNLTACRKADEPAGPAAIVGSWQLSKVLVSEKEGEDPVEVKEEDHASMFEEKDNIYTFNEDGTGTMILKDGADTTEKKAAWTTNEDGSYTVSADGDEIYLYDPVEDILMREYIGNDPYIHVLTVFARQ